MTEKTDDGSRDEVPADREINPTDPTVAQTSRPTAETTPIPPTSEGAPSAAEYPAEPVSRPADEAPGPRRRPGWVLPVIAAVAALLLLGVGFGAGWAGGSATALISFDRGGPGQGGNDRFGGPDDHSGGSFDRHGDGGGQPDDGDDGESEDSDSDS